MTEHNEEIINFLKESLDSFVLFERKLVRKKGIVRAFKYNNPDGSEGHGAITTMTEVTRLARMKKRRREVITSYISLNYQSSHQTSKETVVIRDQSTLSTPRVAAKLRCAITRARLHKSTQTGYAYN